MPRDYEDDGVIDFYQYLYPVDEATLENLVAAMLGIGMMMSPNEQFVFFATDHGDLDDTWWHKLCESGGCYFPIDAPVLDVMLATPDNQPNLTLFTEDPLPPDYLELVMLNGQDLGPQPMPMPRDYEDDGVIDFYQYLYPVDEATLVPVGNDVVIDFIDPFGTVLFPLVSLQSGAIPRIEDETGVLEQEERSWGTIKALYR